MPVSGKKLVELYPRFNEIKARLYNATGSVAVSDFSGGRVHLTLDEYERLVSLAEKARSLEIDADTGWGLDDDSERTDPEMTKTEQEQLLRFAIDFAASGLTEHMKTRNVLVDYVNGLIAEATQVGAQSVPEGTRKEWRIRFVNYGGVREETHAMRWEENARLFADKLPGGVLQVREISEWRDAE